MNTVNVIFWVKTQHTPHFKSCGNTTFLTTEQILKQLFIQKKSKTDEGFAEPLQHYIRPQSSGNYNSSSVVV